MLPAPDEALTKLNYQSESSDQKSLIRIGTSELRAIPQEGQEKGKGFSAL